MANYWLGVFNTQYGHMREAKKHFRAVIKKNPDIYIAYFHLGMTNIKLGSYDEAVDNLLKVTKANPKCPASYALLGEAYMNLEDKFKARKAFKNALKYDPDLRKAQRGINLLDDFNDVDF